MDSINHYTSLLYNTIATAWDGPNILSQHTHQTPDKMSTFGTHFRVTTYGESHCLSVGCIVDGIIPPNMPLSATHDIQPQLSRRRPGQSALTTPRNEKDRVEIQSGTEFGVTLGTPIAMVVRNEDQRPHDYGGKEGSGKGNKMDLYPRPSHADWTYLEKYGVKASSGGGRSSARETIGELRLRFVNGNRDLPDPSYSSSTSQTTFFY